MPETPSSGRRALQDAAYDQGRPQIYSTTLHWSWPPFGLDRTRWQEALPASDPAQLVHQLALSGFQVIWLDRSGYASAADSPESALRRILGPPAVVSADGRFMVFDLRRLAAESMKLDPTGREFALHPVVLEWGEGFYDQEMDPQRGPFRWSHATSRLTVVNSASLPRHVAFRASLQAPAAEGQEVTIHVERQVLTEHVGTGFADFLRST